MANDTATEPMKSVLLPGTAPNFDHYGDQSVFTPDTSATISPGLLCYRDETAANGVEPCDAYYGNGAATTAASEHTIGVVEIPASHPSFPKSYDKDTAFTAATDYFKVHWLRPGDKIWVKGSNVTVTLKQILVCAAAGLVAIPAGTGTIDEYACHHFRPLIAYSGATWMKVEYMGRVYGIDKD